MRRSRPSLIRRAIAFFIITVIVSAILGVFLLNYYSDQFLQDISKRNFDLAHELFHLLTWNIFTTCRLQNTQPTEDEEKLANAFASQLLMPDDALRERIDLRKNEQGEIETYFCEHSNWPRSTYC